MSITGATLEDFSIVIVAAAATAAKSLQPYLTLCDPTDGSPPGSPVPGILQARTLEWVAISWKWKVKGKSLSRVLLLAAPWTAAHQAPPSMGFSRQEYWSGVPLPSPIVIVRTSKTAEGQNTWHPDPGKHYKREERSSQVPELCRNNPLTQGCDQ